MRSRKGIELSINFIVILILSLIIFVGGLVFTTKFFNMAMDEKARLDKETEAKIDQLLADGAPVAIPQNKKAIKRGHSDVFGLGIRNIYREPKDFYVVMSFSKAYRRDNTAIDDADDAYIDSNWIFADIGQHTLNPNSNMIVSLYVEVQGQMDEDFGTELGTYIFNVCVCSPDPCVGACDSSQPNLYGDHINLLYVDVI